MFTSSIALYFLSSAVIGLTGFVVGFWRGRFERVAS